MQEQAELERYQTLTDEQKQIVNFLIGDCGWELTDAYDALEFSESEDAPEAIQRFMVSDMNSANWVLKKIAQTQEDMREIQEMVNTEILNIKKRAEQIMRPLENKVKFFQQAYGLQLEEWAASELEGKKSKSINLIHGKVGFRKSPDKVVLDCEEDEIALEEFKLLGLYDLIRVKEEINKTELKKALQADAEGISNIAHIEPGSDTFYFNAEMPGE